MNVYADDKSLHLHYLIVSACSSQCRVPDKHSLTLTHHFNIICCIMGMSLYGLIKQIVIMRTLRFVRCCFFLAFFFSLFIPPFQSNTKHNFLIVYRMMLIKLKLKKLFWTFFFVWLEFCFHKTDVGIYMHKKNM